MPGVKLTDVNPELVCVLCHGYFIDATAIKECLHSFCRSCIILYLEAKNHCPKCQVPINTSKPHLSLKPDKTRQDIVYKLVPGLFHSEMRRRQEFYKKNCHRDLHLHPEARGVDVDRLIYSPEDPISLSLEYYDSDREKEEWNNGVGKGDKSKSPVTPASTPVPARGGPPPTPQPLHTRSKAPSTETEASSTLSPGKQLDKNLTRKRYLQCPAEVSMHHLKKFIRMKHDLPPHATIELFYKRESLPDDYSLMDIAYIYTWKRNGPMRFYYQIHIPVPIKSDNTVKEAATAPVLEPVPVTKLEPKSEPKLKRKLEPEHVRPQPTSIPKPETILPNETHPIKKEVKIDTPKSTKVPEKPPSSPSDSAKVAPKPKSICYREATYPSPEKPSDPLAAYDFEEEKSPVKNPDKLVNGKSPSSVKIVNKSSKMNGKVSSNLSSKPKSAPLTNGADEVSVTSTVTSTSKPVVTSEVTSVVTSSTTTDVKTTTVPIAEKTEVSVAVAEKVTKEQPEVKKESKEVPVTKTQDSSVEASDTKPSSQSSAVKPSEHKTQLSSQDKPNEHKIPVKVSLDNSSVVKPSELKTPKSSSQSGSVVQPSEIKTQAKISFQDGGVKTSEQAKPSSQDSSAVKPIENKTLAKLSLQNSSVAKPSEQKTPAKPSLQNDSSELKTQAKLTSQESSAVKLSEHKTPAKSSLQNNAAIKPSDIKPQVKTSSQDSSAVKPSENKIQAKPSSQHNSAVKPTDHKTPTKPTLQESSAVNSDKATSKPKDINSAVKPTHKPPATPTSKDEPHPLAPKIGNTTMTKISSGKDNPSVKPSEHQTYSNLLITQLGDKKAPEPAAKVPFTYKMDTNGPHTETSPKPKNGAVRPAEKPPTYQTSDYMNDRMKRFEKLVSPSNKVSAPHIRTGGVSLNRNALVKPVKTFPNSSDAKVKKMPDVVKQPNGYRFDSPGASAKKPPVNTVPSPRANQAPTVQNDLKRKRELERCIETENGCLSVSLLSQSQQEIEAKKMKMVEPDVSIQLMSFADKKDAKPTNPRTAQTKENNESPKPESPKTSESPKLCNSTKSNLSPPRLQPIPGQKREGPLDLSSVPGGVPLVKSTKSPTPPDAKRRKMPPLAPLRVPPPLTSIAELSEKKAPAANEQLSKYSKEALEFYLRQQFNNNNKGSEKVIGELMMKNIASGCQNFGFPSPYSLMRPGNGLSPESVRK